MIFITRDDVLGYELPIYHIDRTIKEVKDDFMDEAHIIYVNAKRQDNTELGRLMHDLHCKNAKDMYSKVLADRAYELKETKMGVEFMCYEMEKIYSEGIENGIEKGIAKGIGQGIEQGIEQGELKKARETALSLVEMGLPVEKIAKAVRLSVEEVQKWIDEGVVEQ